MAMMKFRDENGAVQEVLTLRGPQGRPGVDAYAKSVEYGYEGTEEEFYLSMGQHGQLDELRAICESAETKATEAAEYTRLGLDTVSRAEDTANMALNLSSKAATDAADALSVAQTAENNAADALNDASTAKALAQAAAVEKTITTTIAPNDWAQMGDGAWYVCALAVNNNDHSFTRPPFVDVVTSANSATSKLAEKAFSQVYYIGYGGYDLELYAYKKPSVDITIQVKVVE